MTGEEEVNRGNETKVDETKMRKENNESQNNEVISIGKVRRVLVLLVESKGKLQAVEKIASIYRGCSPIDNRFNEPDKTDESLLHNDAKATRKIQFVNKAKQTSGKVDQIFLGEPPARVVHQLARWRAIKNRL